MGRTDKIFAIIGGPERLETKIHFRSQWGRGRHQLMGAKQLKLLKVESMSKILSIGISSNSFLNKMIKHKPTEEKGLVEIKCE